VLTQIVCALAVAESAFNFEHRDLHWGNVLLKRTHSTSLEYRLEDHPFILETAGIQVTIIDFTLSRLSKGIS